MATRDGKLLVLGKIVGLYGIEGWVKIESYSEPRLRIFKYSPWFVGSADIGVEYAGARGRSQGKGVVAHLPGVDSRDAAAALVGAEIRILRSALPKPKPGEYYWVDLEGLDVVNLEGSAFGKVDHVFSTGANDVLVVRDGERERLVPFVIDEFVKQVDVDGGRILVDWDADF